MVATIRAIASHVNIANASSPTRITAARASIVCVVVPSVTVIAAVPTVTFGRRRRVSPPPW